MPFRFGLSFVKLNLVAGKEPAFAAQVAQAAHGVLYSSYTGSSGELAEPS